MRDQGLSPSRGFNAKDIRRGSTASTSSIDSRSVALEISSEEEKELLGVIDDVRGFIGRRDGLPSYIHRNHIIEELSRALNAKTIDNHKKAEAITMTKKLIDQERNPKEAQECYDIILPSVIVQLGSVERELQQAGIKFIQNCLEDRTYSKTVVQQMVDNGVNHRSHKISIETTKLLPGLFLPYLTDTDLSPLITSLYEQLNVKQREQFAFGALIRHQELLGARQFAQLSEDANRRDQAAFNAMCHNYEDRDYHIAKRRPREGVSFGLIPNHVINRVLDRTNRQERAEGSILLKRELENDVNDLSLLLPYMGSFLKFLSALLDDHSPKVLLNVLDCHDILLKHAPVTIRQHMELTTHNILKTSLESKPLIKIKLYLLMEGLMKICGPASVVELLLQELDGKNPRIREDNLIYIIFALLTFPSNDFNFDYLIEDVVPCLTDPKRRVRQATLECLAHIHQGNGADKANIIFDAIKRIEVGMYDKPDDVRKAVQHRINRRQLARITDEGFVEYGLLIPHTYYTQQTHSLHGRRSKYKTVLEGADVEWILKGSGGISRGTAGQFLGITSSAGALGSNISLQSLRSVSGHSNRDRSNSFDYDSGSSLNGHSKIPEIKRKSRSVSPPHRRNRSNVRIGKKKFNSAYSEGENDVEDLYDNNTDIKTHWKNDVRNWTPEELRLRDAKYDSFTVSQSQLDLRAAAATPPSQRRRRKMSLPNVKEEEQDEEDQEDEEDERTLDRSNQNSPRRRNNDNAFKRTSLALMGQASGEVKTLFDNEDMNDDEAPGAFKNPKVAFAQAQDDLKSNKWQTELDGLDAIVRLIKYHPNMIIDEINLVTHDVLNECKNLRSQVTRAGLQALALMFVYLGREMENKHLENITLMLFLKTGDTNRFIREDANLALQTLVENIAVQKAVMSLIKAGVSHKSTVARTTLARLLAEMVEKLGQEAVMNEASTLEELLDAGIQLILDGSVDTRTEIKRMFKVLINHPSFETALEKYVKSKRDLNHARKALNSLRG
ncbi:TOG array regulator of axonemal microtubules protein 1-like [Tigriopus californicus]|uniref:TOG array regulator of axonemal microtubules protein 1-like n=1 Tax=Tigriopus californicus TaxID=6832 RepID=UPI0027D9E96B|nr:TOG array regulator of axonemal microtubules protein 1-like [Tigriopus californicus]|eukprot:TCALIF_13472-PA protein Name:"Similar to Fam179b Protein FAM179B (Mus musculus)" AED:0.01 eAED:0.01 QI:0/1/0.5/1/1/1/2/141/1009